MTAHQWLQTTGAVAVLAALPWIIPAANGQFAGAQPALAAAQAQPARPVAPPEPEPNGTPVPTTAWGPPDLSGLWNKRLRTNMALGIQPLPFTPDGLKAYNNVWNEIDPTSRCVFPGVPRVNNSPYPMRIVHLPDQVIILYEYMHNYRLIPTDGRDHPADILPSLMGHSVGRWEGDTLVIDTIGLTDRTWLDDHGNRHSDALHVIERFRRVSADQLWYEATIDDPKFYTKAWTNGWMMPLAPPDWELGEYACTDFNKVSDGGHLQPGPLDGSLRDGSAMPPPGTRGVASSGAGGQAPR
jgi:hypothetical protein